MNLKTERLIRVAALRYSIWADDDTDGVELNTANSNLLALQHAVISVASEADPDLDYSPWVAVAQACMDLRNHHRDFEGDLDGSQTAKLIDAWNNPALVAIRNSLGLEGDGL